MQSSDLDVVKKYLEELQKQVFTTLTLIEDLVKRMERLEQSQKRSKLWG